MEPFDADSVGAQGKLPALRKCKACGFTLIELLVVIAIIALLVAILMPSLQQAQDLAKRAKCSVQLRSIGIAINMYADENEEWLPFAMGNPGILLMMHDDNVWRGVFPGGPHRLGLLYCQPPQGGRGPQHSSGSARNPIADCRLLISAPRSPRLGAQGAWDRRRTSSEKRRC